jgi:hypothetical protein
MSDLQFSEAQPVRPKSNRVEINIYGDDNAQLVNVARAIRTGLGILGATSSAPTIPSESDASGGLATMIGVTAHIHTHDSEPGRPWPHNREQFDAYFAVVPDEEEEGSRKIHWVNCPDSVQEVMSDMGTPGVVTEDLFCALELHEKGLEKIGLYKVCVEFWCDGDGEDYEDGFSILSVEVAA